jgi:RimJ/RimL family protein N-acetyltransferase
MSASLLLTSTPDRLETERLILRPLEEGDLEAMIALLGEPDVALFMATLPFPYTRADADEYLGKTRSDPAHRSYAIIDRNQVLMGNMALTDPQDGRPPQLGYWLGKPFWGRGYVTEALDGLIAALKAIGAIERLGARVLVENPASRRVLEKSGFIVTEETTSIIERHRGKPLLVMQRGLS